MEDELLERSEITKGKSRFDYNCTGCGNDRFLEFDYTALHELFESHGQGVEGSVTERVLVDLDIPEIIQCAICGTVYQVEKKEVIYEDYRLSKYVIEEGKPDRVEKATEKKYQVDDIDAGLQEVFDSIRVKSMGRPTRT